MYTYFVSFYDNPLKNGFTKISINRMSAPFFSVQYYNDIDRTEQFCKSTGIINFIYSHFRLCNKQGVNAMESCLYGHNFLQFFKRYINHRSETYKLLDIILLPKQNMDLNFVRIFDVILILLCFTELFHNFIKSAIEKNKVLFYRILKSDETYSLDKYNDDNLALEVLYSNMKTKLIHLCNFVLDERTEIEPHDDLCVIFESFIIRFYNIQQGLFSITLPVWEQMKPFLDNETNLYTLIKSMDNFNPIAGDNFAFYYTQEQFDALSGLLPELNKLQKDIKKYYIDNKTQIDQTPSVKYDN
jgi:hypothetical protein